MKIQTSDYLRNKKTLLRELVAALRRRFEYASVLGTDVSGKRYIVRDKSTLIADNNWVERGFVARVYSAGRYFEYSFNELSDGGLDSLVSAICEKVEEAASTRDVITYPLITEEEITKSFSGEAEIPPGVMTPEEILEKMVSVREKAHSLSEILADVAVINSNTHVSKIFISDKKDLEQSYVWSEAYVQALAQKGQVIKAGTYICSGLKGLEILDELYDGAAKAVEDACKLLGAKPIRPGEYDVICSPAAVGIIVHEAFGHGVEMDMFVKGRAKAAEYIGKPVASSLVSMRDGAASAKHVSSYLFDDEGTLASDTAIIQNGILKTGISDLLSALKLGSEPTGNGKRQSFERKAYTRMTNTFFERGTDKLDDMFASVKHGYYITKASSGMEDPKDWGIQVMFSYAAEIVDGKLTDNIVSPVIMTGYVPDLLKNISMVSDDFELFGSGMCGKGHKEWVKVSDGGPYIKTKARLG